MLCIGMLWFDDSAQPFTEKLARAAAYYRNKHGCAPNVCYVHPSSLSDDNMPLPEMIRIVRMENLLPNHFWLGVAGQTQGRYHPAHAAA
jgi:hypothetical protein